MIKHWICHSDYIIIVAELIIIINIFLWPMQSTTMGGKCGKYFNRLIYIVSSKKMRQWNWPVITGSWINSRLLSDIDGADQVRKKQSSICIFIVAPTSIGILNMQITLALPLITHWASRCHAPIETRSKRKI